MVHTAEHTAYNLLKIILGDKYEDSKVASQKDLVRLSNKGLHVEVLGNICTYFEINDRFLGRIMRLKLSNVMSWIQTGKIDPANSLLLIEITDLFLFGIEVLNNRENLFNWLSTKNVSLGGVSPNELIHTSKGISMVRDILGRIEHGVYS
jgi:putative toxin-antitoxin system antitoxin component (TIGR02293 family)